MVVEWVRPRAWCLGAAGTELQNERGRATRAAVFAGAWAGLVAACAVGAPPKVNHFFPPGVQRGTAAAVTATGDFSTWPVRCWTSHEGLRAEASAEKGKLQVSVASEVPPGVYWLRCVTDEGASSPRPLVVGTVPDVEEAEPNDSPDKWQAVPQRSAIHGRLARNGDVDAFVVQLRKGETLVADLQANSGLGSPMDAVLQVCWLGQAPGARRADAFIMQQNDDTVGIDPRIVYTAPREGDYLLRVFAFPLVPNSTIGFAGGNDFIYRLTVTTGPFIDHAEPLAVPSGQSSEVRLHGWNLDDNQRTVTVAAGAEGDQVPVFLSEAGGVALVSATTAPVLVSSVSEQTAPRELPVPASVTGWLSVPQQRDRYILAAVKGHKYRVRVESRGLGFDTDPAIRLTDSAAKRLDENDDAEGGRDASLVFTAPTNGNYHIEVRDVHGLSGPRHVYRLSLQDAVPDFALRVEGDSYIVTAGEKVEIPVTVTRVEGLQEPVTIQAVGLPEGVEAAAVVSEKSGASAKAVKLVITVPAGVGPVSGPIRIEGFTDAMGAEGAVVHPLRRAASYVLKEWNAARTDVWLTVKAAK
ncbi:MAG: PPC domain-containing protein [Pirellulaceae bacterium]